MATYIIKGTDLRMNGAKIIQGLRSGDSYILMHYKLPVGYLTSEIPEELLDKIGERAKKEDFEAL